VRPPGVAGDPKRSEGPPLQKGEAKLVPYDLSEHFLNYDTVSPLSPPYGSFHGFRLSHGDI